MIVKRYYRLTTLMLAVWAFAGCAVFPDDLVYRDERVEIFNRVSSLPHGTDVSTLVVKGKSFKHLYSYRYLHIAEWNSILFLTHRDGGAYLLHVFSLEEKKDLTIKTDGLRFVGSGIGQPKTNAMTCFVEKVDGDTAILVERAFMAPERRYALDRVKKTLIPMR